MDSNSMKVSLLSVLFLCAFASACGSDDEADTLGIGAECTSTNECDEDSNQACLADFKGGYCGIEDCAFDTDCPESSACIAHEDGTNYCFRTCLDKAECNANRSEEHESNCSANVTFVEEREDNLKACVPPAN